LANPTLSKITKGLKEDITPSNVMSAIKRGREKSVYEKEGKPVRAIPDEHTLSKILNKLEGKVHRGKMLKSGVPLIGGALGSLGGGMAGGPFGAISGGAGGSALAHYTSPHIFELVQNPAFQKLMKHMDSVLRGASQEIPKNF